MIVESLLEMHYHRSLMNLFSSTFGKRIYRFHKPSTRREAVFGYDQAFISLGELDIREYETIVESSINQNTSIDINERRFLGYFFQFKVVHQLVKTSAYTPRNYTTPYYRSEIDLKKNVNTNLSQHETLLRLNSLANSQVYYVCPFLFDEINIYEEPDLDDLKFIDVRTSPTYTTGRHFITFQDDFDSNPKWCSDPIDARLFNIYELAKELKLMNIQEVVELIQSTIRSVSFLPKSFRLIEFYPE